MLRARLYQVRGANMSWEARKCGMFRAQIDLSVANVLYRVKSCATMQWCGLAGGSQWSLKV